MPGGVIAEAFVEVAADNTRFEHDLDAQVNDPLRDVKRTADLTADQIEQVFKALTDEMGQAFRQGSDVSASALEALNNTGFAELRAEADRAAEAVGASMKDNADEAGRQLETLDSKSFEELRSEADRTGEAIEGDFREAARSADRSLDGIESSGRSHLGGLGLAVAGAGAILGTLGGLAVKSGLETAGGLEQSTTAFEGVLGSAEAAQAEMAKLTDFAARTPLELPGLLSMDARLLAVKDSLGLTQEQILPLIGTVGDLASVLGQGQPQMDAVVVAMAQIGSSGRLSAQDVGQLTNALPGFNAWKVIADGMGLTVAQVREMAEQGKLTGEQALPILIQGMKDFPGAAGAMERSAQTLNGQLSTFKDTANIALAQGLAPLVAGIKDQLPGITAQLAPLFGSIGTVATAVFGQLGPLIQQGLGPIASIVTSLAGPLAGVVQVIGSIATALTPGIVALFESLGAALTSLAGPLAAIGGQVGTTLSNVLQIIAPILPPIAAAFGQILTAVTPLLAPLGRLVEMLAGTLAPILVTLVQNLADAVSALFDGLGPAFDSVLDALEPLLPMIADLFAAFSDPETTKELAKSLGELAKSVAEILVAVLPLLEPLIKLETWVIRMQTGATSKVIELLSFLVSELADLASWVAKVIPPLDKFKDWFRTAGGAITGAWNTTWAAVTGAVTTAIDAVIGAGLSVVQFFQTVWAGIDEFIIQPVKAAFDFIRPIFDGFITFVEVDLRVVATLIAAPFIAAFLVLQPVVVAGWAAAQLVFQTAIDWFTTAWNTVNTLLVQPIQAGLDAAFSAASTVWATVQAVFQTGLDWVTSTWATITDLLSGPVKSGIDAASTAVSGAWSTAQGTLQGAIDWVRDTWKTVEGLLETPVDNAVEGIKTVIGGLWDAIKLALNPVIDGLNAVISAWNGLQFTLPEIQLPSFGGLDVGGVTVIPGWEGPTLPSISVGTPDIKAIPRLDTGGLVTAAGLAFLHPAEVVVPAPEAARGGDRVVFNGPVTFGGDMKSSIDELDWWTRFRMASVP